MRKLQTIERGSSRGGEKGKKTGENSEGKGTRGKRNCGGVRIKAHRETSLSGVVEGSREGENHLTLLRVAFRNFGRGECTWSVTEWGGRRGIVKTPGGNTLLGGLVKTNLPCHHHTYKPDRKEGGGFCRRKN